MTRKMEKTSTIKELRFFGWQRHLALKIYFFTHLPWSSLCSSGWQSFANAMFDINVAKTNKTDAIFFMLFPFKLN
jgi:hypothetical protein